MSVQSLSVVNQNNISVRKIKKYLILAHKRLSIFEKHFFHPFSNMSLSAKVCCPRCKSNQVHRVKRSTLVKKFLGFLPLRRFQCLNCLSTFVAKKPALIAK
jgi:hypothetical protein